MATDITSDDFVAKSTSLFEDEQAALMAAHAQAVAEISRIRAKASADELAGNSTEAYSMHEAPAIGRYVIPRRTGWQALLDIIHDPVPNIDFSANVYPAFDGIIGEHFESPYLLDPLNDKYEARQFISLHPGRKPWEDLRDNIAAVRNFLMQQYYASTPDGMTSEKAKQSLAEIAAFVGDGLYNNWLFLGIVPNHNPTKPFIDLSRAQAPHGKGAQYLYEKILEHQRHSNWMKPFTAVMTLFGGKASPDWQLLPASEMHFTDWSPHDIAGEATDHHSPLAQAENNLAAIEAQLQATRDARVLSIAAVDLDAIGNHLVYTATNMDGVAQLSEPVRRDAVDIAKDILRKLKVSIGEVPVLGGLMMKPSDDTAALGAIKGVAMVYERLVAWARASNDSEIFQHPAVVAATQAIGQLGYQAKREGLRMAELAGNYELAKNITEQLQRLPAAYAPRPGVRFGDLLETVESGIDTIINRTQQVGVSGANVGFSVDGQHSGLNSDPTAGMANQVGTDNAAARNAQAMVADQLAAQAQAQRINSQMALQARTQQAANPTQAQQQPPAQPARGSTVGRQSLQAARTQQQQRQPSTVSNPAPNAVPLNAAQRQAAQRHATAAALAAAHEHEKQSHELQMQAQQLLARAQVQKAAAKAAMTKIDPTMLKGIQSATDMRGVTGAPVTGGRNIDPKAIKATVARAAAPAPQPSTTTTTKPMLAEDDKLKNPYAPQVPIPGRPNGGRGY
ncbi:MAG: hypothetical protein ACOYNL_08850 [Rickettsiales bacterium]